MCLCIHNRKADTIFYVYVHFGPNYLMHQFSCLHIKLPATPKKIKTPIPVIWATRNYHSNCVLHRKYIYICNGRRTPSRSLQKPLALLVFANTWMNVTHVDRMFSCLIMRHTQHFQKWWPNAIGYIYIFVIYIFCILLGRRLARAHCIRRY